MNPLCFCFSLSVFFLWFFFFFSLSESLMSRWRTRTPCKPAYYCFWITVQPWCSSMSHDCEREIKLSLPYDQQCLQWEELWWCHFLFTPMLLREFSIVAKLTALAEPCGFQNFPSIHFCQVKDESERVSCYFYSFFLFRCSSIMFLLETQDLRRKHHKFFLNTKDCVYHWIVTVWTDSPILMMSLPLTLTTKEDTEGACVYSRFALCIP